MKKSEPDIKEGVKRLADIVRIVRQADSDFEEVGGSTRHWVIECFLPLLEDAGYRIEKDADTSDTDAKHWTEDSDDGIHIELCHRCNRAPSVVKRVEPAVARARVEQGGIRCWLICQSCEDAGRVQKVESNRWSTFFGAFKHAAWHWNRMIEKQKGDALDRLNRGYRDVLDRLERGYRLEYVPRHPEENDAQFKARLEDAAMRHKLTGGVICSECGKHLSNNPNASNFFAASNLTRPDAEIQYSCSPECLTTWSRRTSEGMFPYCVGYDQDGCPCQHAADCEPFKESEEK